MGLIAASALLVVLVSLAVVDARMLPAAPWTRSVLFSLGCAASGALAWLVIAPLLAPQVVGPLLLPLAALAGIAVYLPTIAVRAGGGGPVSTLVYGFCWCALVFVPTAIMTFALFDSATPLGLAPLDHGGSLATNVAGGAAALGVLLANGANAPRPRTALIERGTAAVAMLTLSLGWLVWLAAAELAIDEATTSILINGAIGGLGGIGGWLVIQRIRHQTTTLDAVAAGLLSGLVAVSAGAPLFTPLSAAIAGFVAGLLAGLFTFTRVRATRRQQWFVVGSHLIAGAVGFVLLGVLATGQGYIFTGDTGITWTGVFSFFEREVLSTLLVAVWSTLVSFVLWAVIRRIPGRRAAQQPAT
jgi:Amt family ammonium transporter